MRTFMVMVTVYAQIKAWSFLALKTHVWNRCCSPVLSGEVARLYTNEKGLLQDFARGGEHIVVNFKGEGGAKAPPEINP